MAIPASNLKAVHENVLPGALCPAKDWLDYYGRSFKESVGGKPGTTAMNFRKQCLCGAHSSSGNGLGGQREAAALLSVRGVPVPDVLLGFSVSSYPLWTSLSPPFPLCLFLLALCLYFSLPAFRLLVFLPLPSSFRL